jgi:glycine/D-amino acid oxidase-like deaminating enzyme
MTSLPRREFLKLAGVGTGALLSGCAPAVLRSGRASSNVIVVGAGAWGGWTALNLRRMGAHVTLVDMFGPGNSRSTSGDETRGVRSSYGDRPHGELWMQWARVAMDRWKQWDAEYAKPLKMQVFFTTGDVILREEEEPFTRTTREWWVKNRIPYEALSADEVRKRWPQFNADRVTVALYEPDAGVVRARRATESVAEVFRYEGGRTVIARAIPPEPGSFDGHSVRLMNGDTLAADAIVFAVGPWLGKTFALMQNRMRAPLGRVFYYGSRIGDQRFTYPNMPSWNYPGVTGWPGLPVDNRGFRVRGGESSRPRNTANGAAPAGPATPPQPVPGSQMDPDTSVRWIAEEWVDRSRVWLGDHFPDLADAPLLETRSCHYELSSSRNFIVDRHPALANVWIAGGGNAEGFKFGPVIGRYIASRVLGDDGDPAIARAFRIPETEFAPAPPTPTPTRGEENF